MALTAVDFHVLEAAAHGEPAAAHVAAANRYEVLMLVYTETQPPRIEQLFGRERIIEMARAGQLGANAMLYAVYRKPAEDASFAMPRQAYYANALNEQMARAWSTVR